MTIFTSLYTKSNTRPHPSLNDWVKPTQYKTTKTAVFVCLSNLLILMLL